MTVKIGINPLSWTNDDMPELGGDTPLEICLSEGKQAGYAGFELGNKFPRNLVMLRAALGKHDLDLVSGWHSGFLLEHSAAQAIEAVSDHLALLKGMGCNVMVFAECTGGIVGDKNVPLSKTPRLTQEQWPEFGERLTQVAEYLLRQGVRMAFHHHMGTVVETENDIDLLMQHTGEAVGLLVDSGHLTFAGGDPIAVINRHGSRVVHVHCKDVRQSVLEQVKASDSSFLNAVLEGVFTVPGDGNIDYEPIFKALKQHRYSGWLVVEAEQDPAKAHPLTYATKGYQYLTQTVAKVGL
jgi:inosose dehydratase